MRRMTLIVMALAMVLGFTQCKKDQPAPQEDNEGVRITLILDGGDNNSKVDVDPNASSTYASVGFENGDVIYVGNNGHYCGYLTHNGTYFAGTISDSDLSTSDYLHFYFIGNKGTTAEPASVSITDQTEDYPVISYAHSTVLYDSGISTYSAQLKNYCAIMKFDTPNIDADITITGMNNTVTVNFGAGDPYSFSKSGAGNITLHKEKGSKTERWAILLPQGEVTDARAYATGYYTTSAFTVPAISYNQHLTNSGAGYTIEMAADASFINADFSVAADRTVKFSKGNLLADVKTANEDITSENCTWKFADNQYYFVGIAAANTAVANNQVTEVGTVDLFGWVGATSSLASYGINSSTVTTAYGSVAGEKLKDDWGNLPIANGGSHKWRTLTKDEWLWLVGPTSPNPGTNCRTSSTVNGTANARFTCATLTIDDKSYGGVIIFPDIFTGGTPSGVTWGTINGHSVKTACSSDGWNALEAAGCVFLVIAGDRTGTSVHEQASNGGYYWSSTSTSVTGAYILYFTGNNPYARDINRDNGCSVRLVF